MLKDFLNYLMPGAQLLWALMTYCSEDMKGNAVMHVLWGVLIAAAGLLMLVCGSPKSEFVVYRLMVARSKILWGENVHRFYQIAGGLVIVFGVLVAFGLIGGK